MDFGRGFDSRRLHQLIPIMSFIFINLRMDEGVASCNSVQSRAICHPLPLAQSNREAVHFNQIRNRLSVACRHQNLKLVFPRH
jgi:hypothetical protein